MVNINIIINTQEHGYFYEHGAELLGAIITAFAFVYTFRRIYKENNTKQIIENYKDEITKILSNQHLNMNLKSLDKINDKINTLSELLGKLKTLDQFINLIEFSADKEMNDPKIIRTKKTKEQEEASDKFLTDRVTAKLKEIEIILNYLEKAQQKLEYM